MLLHDGKGKGGASNMVVKGKVDKTPHHRQTEQRQTLGHIPKPPLLSSGEGPDVAAQLRRRRADKKHPLHPGHGGQDAPQGVPEPLVLPNVIKPPKKKAKGKAHSNARVRRAVFSPYSSAASR